MHYRTMEVEQKKKPGSVLKQNPHGIATVRRSGTSQLQMDMMAAQAGLGNRYVQRMIDRLKAEQDDRESSQPAQPNLKNSECENRTGLPDQLKLGIEQLSGYLLDDVRVHYNSPKPAELQALAYTQGSDIYVASGQERHLPHEAWHVVQQAKGSVQPTTHVAEMPVNDLPILEDEADVMGRQALKMHSQDPIHKTIYNITNNYRISNHSGYAIQLTKYPSPQALKKVLKEAQATTFHDLTNDQLESVANEFFTWYSEKYHIAFRTVDVPTVESLRDLVIEMIKDIDTFTDSEGKILTRAINQTTEDRLFIGYHAGGENKPGKTAAKPFGEGAIKSQLGEGYYITKDLAIAKEYANQYVIQGMIAYIQKVSIDISQIKTLQIKGVSVKEWWAKYQDRYDEMFDIMVASISGKTGKVQYKINPKHKESGLLLMEPFIRSEKIIE